MTDRDPARWPGDAYASSSGHHRRFDDWFLARHPPASSDHVVDAGCGTGEFTARLGTLVPEGGVIGVEPDPSMLATARAADVADVVSFRQGRIQELDTVCAPASADLVVSRAVFHWIALDDYLDCYQAIHRVLKPGGWLHAESGGAGNVPRVRRLLDDVAAGHGLPPAGTMFPDAGVVLELLEQAGFDVPQQGVQTVAQRRSFDREQLRRFVHSQVVLPYTADAGERTRAEVLEAFEARLDELRRHDGTFDQTFVRLDVLCRRPM